MSFSFLWIFSSNLYYLKFVHFRSFGGKWQQKITCVLLFWQNTCLLDIKIMWRFLNWVYFFVKIMTQKSSSCSTNHRITDKSHITLFPTLSRTKHTILFSPYLFSCLNSFFIYVFLLISFLSSYKRKEHKPPSMKPPSTNLFEHVVPPFNLTLLCHIIADAENSYLIKRC